MNTAATITFLTCVMLCVPAQAQIMSTFKDSVLGRFNEQDVKLLQDTMDATLSDPADGASHAWRNEKSGASGTVTSLKTYDSGQASCRDLKITNRYKGQESQSVNQFCKNAEGAWKLVKLK